jgi:plastocyanin
MRKLLVLISVLALAAFALGACGGDDDEDTAASDTSATQTTSGTGEGAGGTISISADPDGAIAYAETSVTAPAGDDTVEFDNPASLSHDVVIEDPDGNEVARTDVIAQDTATTTAQLEPGEYTFFCSVDGHREQGMEGTLTVK